MKYPEVQVQLSGNDGNAYAILGAVTNALKKAGVEKAERDAFYTEATADDYDHLLRTAMKWVSVS